MRKRIIEPTQQITEEIDQPWLNLEEIAQVEITSELEGFPIESALALPSDASWRAASAGEQTIRLLFDEPRSLSLIRLLFEEEAQERTQEFVLRYSCDAGQNYHDITRQQYNFSSPDSTRELESYNVDVHGVTALELIITPDINGGNAHASLSQWAVA